MKSLYTIAFLTLSIIIHAQERTTELQEDQALIVKQAKEHQAQLMKSIQETTPKQQTTQLVSEQGLEVKKQQEAKTQPSNNNSGKLLPNTATLEEVLATIPNRQKSRKTDSRNTNNHVQGLPNTATLEEIKKTIPKN
ncbi:hypothetical protein [Chryseobacterium defluvii]|uniref:Uncharacterized protein n=1 Tax=Chryseobacterium defluvii TaxID=160396 RepID=A0A495S9G1_9FLAO|nr:hypothetical protein [Chryseobacterium defluvii]RKS96472.1 hypothetical protein BCF58_2896 [Chryseobacterium defluvii]